MNKDDFIAWRNSAVTEKFLESAVNEIDNLVSDLVNSAGDNPLADKYRRGQIVGLQWLVDWRPQFDKEVNIEETDKYADSEGSQDSY